MKKGEKTLILSVFMSLPGPILSLVSVFQSSSSTQLADFVRRTAELIAMIVSLIVFHLVNNSKKEIDEYNKQNKERKANIIVSICMMISFVGMVLSTTIGINDHSPSGNVMTGLIIAALGLVANTILFIRYMKLSKKENDTILHTQGLLYRAKVLVDFVVTIVLTMILLLPNNSVTYYFDIIGSYIVSFYVLYSSIKILSKNKKKILKKD